MSYSLPTHSLGLGISPNHQQRRPKTKPRGANSVRTRQKGPTSHMEWDFMLLVAKYLNAFMPYVIIHFCAANNVITSSKCARSILFSPPTRLHSSRDAQTCFLLLLAAAADLSNRDGPSQRIRASASCTSEQGWGRIHCARGGGDQI
jgi:hypothetical protein